MVEARTISHCRLCHGSLSETALSLGDQRISNHLLRPEDAGVDIPSYPLDVVICRDCGLPQLKHDLDATAHFHDDYAYISGASSTWVDHCGDYAAALVDTFELGPDDLVVEPGSNDGTLLKEFVSRNVKVLGVEPSGNVADLAREIGVETMTEFFNAETAQKIISEYGRPKAFIGNNVLAHVPDTNAFLSAARDLIREDGFLCFEFPHFTRILSNRYFDTIYHEHYIYLGVGPLMHWAEANGMAVVDVQPQVTHGGSLRIFLEHRKEDQDMAELPQTITDALAEEKIYSGLKPWRELSAWLVDWRQQVRNKIDNLHNEGKIIAGYAAASKATVSTNYLGLTKEDIPYCCDASPIKQGRIIPGSGIPVVPPSALTENSPDAVFIFAWNIFDEISGVISDLIDKPVEIVQLLPELTSTMLTPRPRK